MIKNNITTRLNYWLICSIVLVLISTVGNAHDEAKIAVVDLEVVVIQSPQGIALQSKLQKFQEDAKNEGEQMTKQAQEIRNKIQEGSNSLPQNVLADLQRQLEDKAIQIRRFQEEKQREGQQIQNNGLKEIEKSLEPVMKQLQDQYGFDLILNNSPGVVVMASEKVDITQLVIDTLRN